MILRIETEADLARHIRNLRSISRDERTWTQIARDAGYNRAGIYRLINGRNCTLRSVIDVLESLGATLMVTTTPGYYERA